MLAAAWMPCRTGRWARVAVSGGGHAEIGDILGLGLKRLLYRDALSYCLAMNSTGSRLRPFVLRGIAILVPVAAVSAAVVWRASSPAPAPARSIGFAAVQPQVQVQVQVPVQVQPGAPPVPQPPAAPSFDIVRVSPSGTAVIAGRAEPGATVTVRDGDRLVGQARTDSRGEWVVLPEAPLRPGGQELSVASRSPDGIERRGDSVLLAVPTGVPTGVPVGPQVAAAPPAVLLMPAAGGAPRLLGTPDPAVRSGALAVGSVDYDDRGDIRFAGSAKPGVPVRVYVDNTPAGQAVADPAGRWSLRPPAGVVPGLHRLRVDQVTDAGRVTARVEVPFQRTSLPASELAGGRVVVQPGQNLWRLARSAYGSGVRYTVIYLANREQIRDPGRIYPGQAFALPEAPPQP